MTLIVRPSVYPQLRWSSRDLNEIGNGSCVNPATASTNGAAASIVSRERRNEIATNGVKRPR